MASATITSERAAVDSYAPRECRVYERYPSELPTQCQPLAARGDNDIAWSATVRDISAGGLGLVLQRRFEPRTGLAVELPDNDGTPYTVFVRVAHATAEASGGWRLGCSFVSPLSDERLNSLLEAAHRRSQPTPSRLAATTVLPSLTDAQLRRIITGVHFRAQLPDGNVLSRSVTRLHVTGDWPMPPGRIVTVWIGKGKMNGATVSMKVNHCHQEGGQWFVDCTCVTVPPAEVVESLVKRRSKSA